MLDLVRFSALALGIARATRSRAPLAMACAAALACGFLGVGLAVLRASGSMGVTGEYGFGLAFIGTSFVPLTAPWLLASHPIARQLGFSLVALAAYADAARRSSRLRPETDEARRWDALGTPFLLMATIELALAVLLALMEWARAMPGP